MQIAIPDQALIANGFVAASRQIAIATNIPNSVTRVTTQGFYTSSDGGGAVFTRVAGPLNDGASFQSADGAWWQIANQTVTPAMFGAKGDGVTDDITALNLFGAYTNASRYMPKAQHYITTYPFNYNGVLASSTYSGLDCDPETIIIQGTNNIPVMTAFGSRLTYLNFPILQHKNLQPATNYGAIGLLIDTKPNAGGNGLYICNVENIIVKENSAVGFFNPRGFSSTLSATALAGATTVSLTNAPTALLGLYPFVAGMWVQIKLDDNTYHITQIKSIAGIVLTLVNALPSQASAGKIIAHSSSAMSHPTDTVTSQVFYSNVIKNVLITVSSTMYYPWIDLSGGTNNYILSRYIKGLPFADFNNLVSTCVGAIYETARNGDLFGQTNIENMIITDHAWWHDGSVNAAYIADGCVFDLIHFEGIQFKGNDKGLLAGYLRAAKINFMEVVYCQMTSDYISRASVFFPWSNASTSIGGNKGSWVIDNLVTVKNMISNGVGYLVRDASSNNISIQITNWQVTRDGGFYPTGQLTYPFNQCALTNIKNYLPSSCVGYSFDAPLNDNTVYTPIYMSNVAKYSINAIQLAYPSLSLNTATAGVYADSGGVSLITTVNNNSLSALTGYTKCLTLSVPAGEANNLRNSGSATYLKAATAQPLSAAIATATSSYCTGRTGGNTNTDLGYINFSAPHGLTIGQIITITGSATSVLNATFKIVDVPSTTQIVVYVDSKNPVGSQASPTPETAMSIQLIPTVNVYITGNSMNAN